MNKKIRIALVTSQVTYIPDNYLKLFDTLFSSHSHQIKTLICLKNIDFNLFTTMAKLRLVGVKNISKTLLKNASSQILDPRKKLCQKFEIDYQLFQTVNCPEYVDYIKFLNIDLVINIRTRFIYKKDALKAPNLGSWNIHHGLLPKYRGTMCDLNALYEGREAGFSIHQMNEKIDDGNIIKAVPVSEGDSNYMEYLKKAASKEAKELSNLLLEIESKGVLPEGMINKSKEICFTKNPDKEKIKLILQKGIVL